ncbi:MAG TPA: hypothetical protein VFT74_02725 [Isosphaeraceae bacterium]|nr:hypothetical protein [Isosphaeraceae bacterium]
MTNGDQTGEPWRIRWTLGHLMLLVLSAAILFSIYRYLWGPKWRNAVIALGANLVLLVSASVGSCYAEPRWRRFWLGYAGFGWLWLALVLRDYLGMLPDLYAPNKTDFSILGIGLGVLCGLTTQFLPGMRKT